MYKPFLKIGTMLAALAVALGAFAAHAFEFRAGAGASGGDGARRAMRVRSAMRNRTRRDMKKNANAWENYVASSRSFQTTRSSRWRWGNLWAGETRGIDGNERGVSAVV